MSEAELRAERAEYLERLQATVARLTVLRAALRSEPASPALLDDLRTVAHRTAGSGGLRVRGGERRGGAARGHDHRATRRQLTRPDRSDTDIDALLSVIGQEQARGVRMRRSTAARRPGPWNSISFADDEANRRQPRVLIVDDDPAALKFLTDRCAKMGMAVQTASNGLQALIIARRTRPDALIVDVHMPELDGLSLCSRLLEPNQPGIDVIVVSGYSDADCSDRCDSLGAAFVRKGPALWSSIQICLHEMFPGMSVEVAAAAAASRPSAQLRERPLVLVIDDDPDVAGSSTPGCANAAST